MGGLYVDTSALGRVLLAEPDAATIIDAIDPQAAVELHKEGTIEAVLTFDHQLQAGCTHHDLRLAVTRDSGVDRPAR
ncbi:hypothetical protein [Conexibacter sp. DBS9H8]|uniref:hypothetical protein n=1 Tax=Conexibacter sp. DBS9H8 TaxID=2937801 RepID=UPI00200D8631|nr:hypothetical protein [Conexibacter sp. DBS9H8]